MTTYDIASGAGCLCGLLMVLGGMVLLYTGAVSLNQASKEEAASLEFKRMFRLTTHYPALGLFIIGLAFIVISLVAPPPNNRITMTGTLLSPVESLDPEFLKLSLESSIKPVFDPNNKSITVDGDPTTLWQVVITYPGMIAAKPVRGNRRNIVLGNITLVPVAEKPPVDPEKIAPVASVFHAAEADLRK